MKPSLLSAAGAWAFLQAPAWACNCISAGATQRVLDTYLGITLLLSLLPLTLGGGAAWWIWKQGHRN